MHRYVSLAVALLFVGTLALPLTVYAFVSIIPFGGKVTSTFFCLNGGIYFTDVSPTGIGSGSFVWTPASLTYPYGPPHLGAWIIGSADVPYGCVISIHPPVIIPALRVTQEAASLLI